MTKEVRLKWLDLAKGIGILFVLIGHSVFLPQTVRNYIYSFHMPLFMILSGFLFRYNSNIKTFIQKKIKTLIVPYITFFVILFVAICIKDYIEGNLNLKNNFFGILFQKPGYIYSIWFLISLFFVEIIYNFILKYTKNNNEISLITILFIIVSYFYFNYKKNKTLFLEFQYIFTLLPFFSLGYILKEENVIKKICSNKLIIINLISSLLLFYLKQKYFIPYTSITSNVYGDIILFYIIAITSSFAIIGICYKINSIKCIDYIGKNSLVYFCLQQPLILFPAMIIIKKVGINYLEMNAFIKLFISILSLAINVILLTGINLIFTKTKLKILIGKRA